MPAAKDLSLYAYDDFELVVAFANADGSPKDLTGLTVAAWIATQPGDDGEALASFTVGYEADDPTLGILRLALPGAATGLLPTARRSRWDLALVDPDGRRHTYLAGAVLVRPAVSV